MTAILSYQAMMSNLSKDKPTSSIHLLLGNGFSIDCDERFRYDKLYEVASADFSGQVRELFEMQGTCNFEGVLQTIEKCISVSGVFEKTEFVKELRAASEVIKSSLISALLKTHMTNTGDLSDSYKKCCGTFLKPYYNVFTTNYDLLLYWVEMANKGLQENDGFRTDTSAPDADYVVFAERAGWKKSILYLHGALHIYRKNGQLRKHTWCRTSTPLIDGIRAGFELAQFPLFVAEGESDKKLHQINSDPYLDYCLGKLGRIENTLVTLGFSFSESDKHIVNKIAKNHKIKVLCIGLFGSVDTDENVKIRTLMDNLKKAREEEKAPIDLKFFDSTSAPVWRCSQS